MVGSADEVHVSSTRAPSPHLGVPWQRASDGAGDRGLRSETKARAPTSRTRGHGSPERRCQGRVTPGCLGHQLWFVDGGPWAACLAYQQQVETRGRACAVLPVTYS